MSQPWLICLIFLWQPWVDKKRINRDFNSNIVSLSGLAGLGWKADTQIKPKPSLVPIQAAVKHPSAQIIFRGRFRLPTSRQPHKGRLSPSSMQYLVSSAELWCTGVHLHPELCARALLCVLLLINGPSEQTAKGYWQVMNHIVQSMSQCHIVLKGGLRKIWMLMQIVYRWFVKALKERGLIAKSDQWAWNKGNVGPTSTSKLA